MSNLIGSIRLGRSSEMLSARLSGLLTARFLLSLRKWNDEQSRNDEACLSLPRFASGTSGDGTTSASLPQFTSTRSTGSVLDELGGDIGPRENSSVLEETGDDYMDPDVVMRSSSIVRNGKRREDPADIDEDHQPRVLSATQ